jgi:GWxTD domain-containing protein
MHPTKSVVFFLFIFLFTSDLFAQRGISYPELSARNTAPAFYYDQTVIPVSDNKDNVLLHFRFAFNALNFRAITAFERSAGAPESANFFSEVDLMVEIEKLGSSERRPTSVDATSKRVSWSDIAFTDTYENTQSARNFIQGSISLQLEPGEYIHRVFIQSDNKDIRFTTNERQFSVPDFQNVKKAPIQFLSDFSNDKATLLNFGRTVLYAQDVEALIYIPNYSQNYTYTINVDEVRVSDRDTAFVKTHYSAPVGLDVFFSASEVSFTEKMDQSPQVKFTKSESGVHTFAHITIPKSSFPNSHFQVYLSRNGETIAHRYFRSLWIDIPISLLNLDVAINMMQYIVDQNTFREMRRGTTQEREEKFRKFWKERDPQPDSDYNPLMVEYFNRVDIAFDRFSSPTTPGYESDRGKTFLRNGEPDEISRTFPSGRPATEVWRYGQRTFIFEATSGFGDFVLVRQTRP